MCSLLVACDHTSPTIMNVSSGPKDQINFLFSLSDPSSFYHYNKKLVLHSTMMPRLTLNSLFKSRSHTAGIKGMSQQYLALELDF